MKLKSYEFVIAIIIVLLVVLWFWWEGYRSDPDRYFTPKEQLVVATHIMPLSKEADASFLSIPNTFNPKLELPDNSTPITPFIIPGGIAMGQYFDTMDAKEIVTIEKLALGYINKDISPADKLTSTEAEAEMQLSSDLKFAKYTINIQHHLKGGSSKRVGYTIIIQKTGNGWIIIDVGRSFEMESTFFD